MIRKIASALILAAIIAVGSPVLAAIDPQAKMDENVVVTANIVLTFMAPVDPSRSFVEVHGTFGRIPVGALRHGRREDLLAPLADGLPPGTYVVKYKAIAVDGSKMFGSTSITISPTITAPNGTHLMGAK